MVARGVAARLRAFGFPLLGALLVLVASLWAFGAIAEDLLEDDTGNDQRLADWLHGRATDPLTDVFRAITWLGNLPILLAVTLLAVGILWRRRERTDAVFVALAFLGGQVLSNGMKLGFRRERPFFPDPLATESTYSFPSGHALVSLAVYGSIALVLAQRVRARGTRLALLGGTAALVLAIGFSRLYLGVHFLSDVLAGYAAGVAWLALLYLALEARTRWRLNLAVPGLDERVEAEREQTGGHEAEQERPV
jgi:membrane-associated phospholipid phosphatase